MKEQSQVNNVGAGNIAYSASIKNLLVAPIALVASLMLFSVLADLTSPGDAALSQHLENPQLDFLLVRQDSDLELRSRKRPPPT